MLITDPEVRTTTLPNGLRVATAAMPGFRTVAIGAWLRVGSRDEPTELNGLSHFYEHMAFKGTALRDARAITLEIERLGGSINAYTAKDHTACETLMLADHADTALAVMADVLSRSVFPPDEIERERQVILQELGDAADDPESVAQDVFDALAFPRQALGRPILGRPRNIRRIGREHLLDHQSRHCTGANLVVSAVGAVEHEAFVAMVHAHFGGLPRGERPARAAARYVGGYRHLDDDTEQTSVVLGWPVYELLGELLGGATSSPLFQAVRETRGLAYQVDAWTELHPECGVLQLTAGVAPRHVREFLNVSCDELNALARHISPEDLERTRNQYMTQLARLQERPMDLAETLGRDLLMQGRATLPHERLDAAKALEPEQLRHAAQTLLAQSPTLTLVGPPARGDLLAAVRRRLSPPPPGGPTA